MRLLFLACLSPKTGNCTTAERIRKHIESAGHICVLRDIVDFHSPADVTSLVSGEPSFEGALAIHLYKGGRLLLGSKAPYGIIFGGTDLNQDVKDEKKRAVMEQVLKKARFAVAFSYKMKEEAEVFWLSQSSKIYIQPQGIETGAAPSFSWRAFLKSSGVNGTGVEDLRVFLLVCGLRRVKDPLYLVEAFSEWHAEDPSVILIIIGPKIDPVFTGEVEVNVERARGVYLTTERSQEELHAALKMCFALVNSSVSEGMSAAILEAMHLGVPVVARDIPGNAAIIRHEDTGLLFATPQEFVTMSKRLLEDRPLLESIVSNGKRYVEKFHSLAEERIVYQKLVELLL
ncbi:glycosyltransferase 1 domain-containing protein 1 isoform X1 [Anguilla anguilla]|uniref:glycosyltransferase 1 domain-containing protein 1 isoform X1 n=2 Tax=Anguilla anguilla TaxID=7936 RepID=UPI0015AA6138|nr:glycosyltransferase 1 domain-containing protein 1 isoform X1 [Anguilla anguilla]